MKKILIILLLVMFTAVLMSDEPVKKPMKAACLSLLLPGGGQIYNESYFKSGLVIALEGSLIGLTLYHQYKSDDYYDKYADTGNEAYYTKYSDHYYSKQNTLWWLGVTVFLSTIDAYVDAHLYDFDKKKDKIHLKFDGEVIGLSYDF